MTHGWPVNLSVPMYKMHLKGKLLMQSKSELYPALSNVQVYISFRYISFDNTADWITMKFVKLISQVYWLTSEIAILDQCSFHSLSLTCC